MSGLQTLILLPFIILFAIIKYRNYPRFFWLKNAFIIIFTLILTISPWVLRNYSLTGEFVFDQKEQTDFVAYRYTADTKGESNQEESNTNFVFTVITTIIKSPSFFISFFINHFTRNVICTLMVIPPNLQGHSFESLYKTTDWWTSHQLLLKPSETIGLFIIFCVIIFGIIRGYKKVGFSGLIPLLLFFGYNISNGLVRNSGGRYNLPVDWVGYTYFAIGAISFVHLFLIAGKQDEIKPSTIEPIKNPRELGSIGKTISYILLFVFISSLIPITEIIFPKQFGSITNNELKKLVEMDPRLYAYVNNLMDNPDKIIIYGKELYPKFYQSGQGEPGSAWVAYSKQDYDRIGFQVIHSDGRSNVIFKTKDIPRFFPNRMEVLLIGEYQTAYIKSHEEEFFSPDLILFPNTNPLIYYFPQAVP